MEVCQGLLGYVILHVAEFVRDAQITEVLRGGRSLAKSFVAPQFRPQVGASQGIDKVITINSNHTVHSAV